MQNLRTVLKELMAVLSFTGVPFLPLFPDPEIKVCSQCYAGNQYLSPDQNSRFLASEFKVSGFKFSIQTTPFFL